MAATTDGRADPLGRVLEWGLAATVFAAPLPFGAVLPGSLLTLEVTALALLAVWLVRAALRPTVLPPPAMRIGLVGLLAWAAVQVIPLGPAVDVVSPAAAATREASRIPAGLRDGEAGLLGMSPEALDPPGTLSLDPPATVSALRTGAALVALLLVATTVAAARGVRLLCVALLAAAAFQGLYGVLVLASGHDMIWNVPKRHYLESATGTFVNRNHYAGFLNAALCAGLAPLLRGASRIRQGRTRRRFLDLLGPDGSRLLLLSLMAALGLAGLLVSFSRAGIAIGLVAVSGTVWLATGVRRRLRVGAVLLLIVAAGLPLSQIGSERLAERYAATASDFAKPGGRATVWRDTLRMARAYPIAGTGFGTFQAAYPSHRSADVRLFFRHAHNDLLQSLAEGGAIGAVLLALVLWGPLASLPRVLGGAKGTAAIGIAAGLAALAVHALVDFQFHIPANAALAAVLAGALMGRPWIERA